MWNSLFSVNAPVGAVYSVWNQVLDFPKFITALKDVRQVGENRYLWRGEIHGQKFESTTEVSLQTPEHRFAWRSLEGPDNSGVVCFEAKSNAATEVTLKIKFVPNPDARSQMSWRAVLSKVSSPSRS